ncbi:TB2/DP1 [Hexamita inflata]|uniref:HVA22 family protein n=1 Tax=Hexamita inflata TaxID=28002 RepID=A0AA86QP83_9EUKA|nr:HVA22 family protein [Hexamita inflata]
MFIESIGQQMYSIIIPIYKSLKAAKSDQITDKQQWLAYWIIFTWVKYFEYSLNWVVQHIPYYQQVKPIFFAWLIRHNGALKLYNKVLAQTFIKIQLYVNDKQYRSSVNQNQLQTWENNIQFTKKAFKHMLMYSKDKQYRNSTNTKIKSQITNPNTLKSVSMLIVDKAMSQLNESQNGDDQF